MHNSSHTLSPSNVRRKWKVCDGHLEDSGNILSRTSVKRGPPLDRDDERCTDLPERHPAMSEIPLLTEASSSDPVLHNTSHFAGAHNCVVSGGKFTNILGNYIVFRETKDLDPDRSLKAIIPDFPVFHRKDVHPDHEIYKGPGYRLYSAKSSGRVVSVKFYEGSHAEERCSKAARFYRDHWHPKIPELTAVSSSASKCSFLVFDGEYEGTMDYILGRILKKGLKQIVLFGLQTVIGLSLGLDYLQGRKYPFKSIGPEHFVLFSSKGRVIISFDPEELGQSTQLNEQSSEGGTDDGRDVLDIFNGLCTKTFDAARKAHYQNEQIQSTFFDDDEDYTISYDDVVLEDELKLRDTQEILGATQSSPKPASKPVLKRRPNGRRQELVWRPPTNATIILREISRNFKEFLDDNRSSLEPALNRRPSRHTTRTPHRCPGYNRIEINLTANITRSAIVTHSSPTLHEICSVCGEVVKDTEIFNCICGNDDDESIPTVRCSQCFEWHHRPCVHYFDLDPRNFICGNCMQPLPASTNTVKNGFQPSFVFEESEGAKEGETGPNLGKAAPDDQSKAMGQRVWAVLIGNDKYNTWKQLYGCISNTEPMREYLRDHLGVPNDRVRLLHNASREAMINTFYDLRDNADIQFGDNILIHFSGHGASYDAKEFFSGVSSVGSIEAICPSDRNSIGRNIPDISDRELDIILSEVRDVKGGNITFSADCCHSGGMIRENSVAGKV